MKLVHSKEAVELDGIRGRRSLYGGYLATLTCSTTEKVSKFEDYEKRLNLTEII